MKRRINWSCKPASFGYHLVATADVGGKSTDVNVAIDQLVWDSHIDRKALLADVAVKVNNAFNTITATMSQRPAYATLH